MGGGSAAPDFDETTDMTDRTTLWTYIVSCHKWLPFGRFRSEDQAFDFLHDRGQRESARDADGNPIWRITDGRIAPPLPYRRTTG